ncbi:reverse transcriptase domain-containing protein [Tanacetum coccineum]
MNDLESDDESVDTPLVSPFPHSDNDSDNGEVLNELIEYENVGMLRREKAINSFDGDDLAFQCMIGFRKSVAYFDPFLPINIITRSFTYITDFVVLEDIGEFILIEKENEPEVTKDTVQPSTENIQPPVVQTNDQIGEPVVASKTKPTLPYPSRANKEKLHEKDNLLASKFMEIFRNLHLRAKVSRFLIPCDFPEMNECLALAISRCTLNLMPPPLERKLSLPALTKTRMILELADRTISTPTGIAEDVFVKVGTFFFPADFVVVDYVADPRVPLILGRPFLRTARALIDVHGEQMTLRHDDQSVTFKGSDFLMEEIDEFLEHDDSIPPGVEGIYDSEGDTAYLEELLSVINNDPNLPPSPVCEINVPEKVKSSCEDPPDLELKDLPSHLDPLAIKKFSKSGIEVDKSKVDVIAKLPHPTTVKVIPKLRAKFQSEWSSFEALLLGWIARIVKTLVLSVLSFIHKSFTSSASFWESRTDIQEKDKKKAKNKQNRAQELAENEKTNSNQSQNQPSKENTTKGLNLRPA